MQGFPFDSYLTFDEHNIPQFDRGISSKPLRQLISKLFTDGVAPNPSNNLQVRAGEDGMTVIVSPGFAITEGGLCPEEEERTLSITAADATFDRIDTVVVRWNENDAVRRADLHVLQGTPARNPERPELTRTGSIYEIGLADIFVTKGIVTITDEKITDTRMETARCGIISAIDNWDTTTIYQQIQSELANFKSNEEEEFTTWFDYMKDQLTEDAAGRLQTEVDEINTHLDTTDSDIDGLKDSVQNVEEMIAVIEPTTTARYSHTVGSYLTLNGALRKVTSAIAVGDEITNSNTEITNAGAEISQINADLTPIPLMFTTIGGTTIVANNSYKVGNMLFINVYVGLPQINAYSGANILKINNTTLSSQHIFVASTLTTEKKWVESDITADGTIRIGTIESAVSNGDRVVISCVIPI